MRLLLATALAASSVLLWSPARAADPCVWTFQGDLPANSTTTLDVPPFDCPGQNYLRVSLWKPKNRTLIVQLSRGTAPLVGARAGESETRLTWHGDYPTNDYSDLKLSLVNEGPKMRNVKVTVTAYTQE